MQKIRFKAQRETANKDKQGQDSPGPGVTHSQGDMAHYSPFAVGRELKRRGRDGGCEGVGGCVLYEEGRQLSPNGEKKGQLVTKSPVQPSWPQGRIPLWSDPFWPFPPNLCAQRRSSATGSGTGGLREGAGGVSRAQFLSPINSHH